MKNILKKFVYLTAIFFLCSVASKAQSPKIIGDCTVSFSVSSPDASLNNTTKTFYLKGKMSRVDIESPTYKQSTIYDASTGNAAILKELGGNKYLYNFSAAQWAEKNKDFDGMQVSFKNETKTILGYECKKAVLTLKNGTETTVYYATTIKPSIAENPFQFKGIPGFVLEYESGISAGKKISYTATKINFNPVAASLFEIPKTGYRVMPG